MGRHDAYGKSVMKSAIGVEYTEWGDSVQIDYGAGPPARIDGTVGADIAVEIESRVFKQIRGAVLDLICHKYPKKLLVILPVHMSNPNVTAEQCEHILSIFLNPVDFRVVLLQGSGDHPAETNDAQCVRNAISELRGS